MKALQVIDRRKKPLAEIDQRMAELLQVPVNMPPEKRTKEWYAARAVANNTYRAYRSSLRDYVAWAGLSFPLPATPHVVAQYLTDHSHQSSRTLAQRVNALSYIHRVLNYPDPTKDTFVRQVLKGIRRTRAEEGEEVDSAPAFTLEQFRALIEAIDTEYVRATAALNVCRQQVATGIATESAESRARGECLRLLRDRAYLLLGLFGGFRQSEMTGLMVDRIVNERQGISISMGRVKQDQENKYRYTKAIPFGPDPLCPVRTLEKWLSESEIYSGPVFRAIGRWGDIRSQKLSHTSTNDLIKKWALKAGLVHAETYSGHSLRASFVTILRDLGVPDAQIARQTHHKNLQMMQVYDRSRDAFRGNGVSVLVEALRSVVGDQ